MTILYVPYVKDKFYHGSLQEVFSVAEPAAYFTLNCSMIKFVVCRLPSKQTYEFLVLTPL